MYLYLFTFAVTSTLCVHYGIDYIFYKTLHLQKTLENIEKNTSDLREYTEELVEKTRKVDLLVQKIIN